MVAASLWSLSCPLHRHSHFTGGRDMPEAVPGLPSHPANLQAEESLIKLWEFTDLANYCRVPMHDFYISLNS